MNAPYWILSLASLFTPSTQAPAPAAGFEASAEVDAEVDAEVETMARESVPLEIVELKIVELEIVEMNFVAAPSRDWIAKSTDSVVGLKEASQVSNPAVVDWQALLEATPEVRKLRSQKIAEDSPEGIQLLTEAANRATTACESLRASQGYCSVWKSIRHKDGRAVADITDLVKAQL